MISISDRRRSSPLRVAARLATATLLTLGVALTAPSAVIGLASAPVSATTTETEIATETETETGAEDEPRLRAVRFELSPGDRPEDGPLTASGEAMSTQYAELQVNHGGIARRLRPLAGSFTATPVAAPLGLAVEIEGLRIGPAADGFTDTLGEVVANPSVGTFLRFDTNGVGEPAVVDITLPRPLETGDYLLVQEAGGDDSVELFGLDSGGQTTGPARTVTSPYRWNSGRMTADGERQWASIVDPSAWIGDEPVTGIRIVGAKAEVKVLVLEPATGVIPLPLADIEIEAPPTAIPIPGAAAATTPIPIPSEAAPFPEATDASTPADSGEPVTTEDESPAAVPMVESVPDPAPEPVQEPATEPADGEAAAVAQPAPAPAADEILALPAQTSDVEQAPPVVLAMTGVSTDPWVLVALATGLIFFGYTTFTAFRRPAHEAGPGESKGHDQLDALGFE